VLVEPRCRVYGTELGVVEGVVHFCPELYQGWLFLNPCPVMPTGGWPSSISGPRNGGARHNVPGTGSEQVGEGFARPFVCVQS
jgi:hypothetical protein